MRLWSAERRPSVVFDRMGKKATSQARISSARSIRSKPTQMMISGAMATTGVTCSTTA